MSVQHLLADAGYDSESNHVYARNEHGIVSSVTSDKPHLFVGVVGLGGLLAGIVRALIDGLAFRGRVGVAVGGGCFAAEVTTLIIK